MADYFALLDEPRRPWLDPEELKAKFHALTATVHPDRVQQKHMRAAAVDAMIELYSHDQPLSEE